MDGAEKILEKIREDAQSQVASNMEKAKKEAEAIIKAANEEALKKYDSILDRTKKEVVEKKKRFIAVAELEGRKIRLEAKQNLIKEVFSSAHKKISSLPAEKYRTILSDMILNLSPKGDEEIIVSEQDKKKLGDTFIEMTNKKLSEHKFKGNMKYSAENREIGGGFILKSGNIETNSSFDSMLKMEYNEIESEVIKVLFG